MPKLVSPYVKPYKLKRSKTGILMIHGFTGSPAKYHHLKNFLRDNTNYSLLLPRLSGHGTNVKDMAKTSRKDWKRDVMNAYKELNKECDKIYVIGFSMGGLLALILASKKPVEKVVLIEPALFAKNPFSMFAPIVRHFIHYIGHKSFQKKFPKEAKKYDLKYNIEYDRYPVKNVVDLIRLEHEAKDVMKKVKCPVTIIQSPRDDLVIPSSATYIYDHIGSKKKDIYWLKESRHICILGPEREEVFKHVLEFLS